MDEPMKGRCVGSLGKEETMNYICNLPSSKLRKKLIESESSHVIAAMSYWKNSPEI